MTRSPKMVGSLAKASRDQYPDALVRRARLIISRGYSVRETRLHLLDEGHDVPLSVLENWIYKGTRAAA